MAKKEPEVVTVTVDKGPNIKEAAKIPTEVVEVKKSKDNNPTILLIYLLYKTNMISRDHLKTMLKEVNNIPETGVIEWLVKEAAR